MLDKIIVSTDDSMFSQYVPVVSAAWKRFFPECELNIAYVTNRSDDDEYVNRMRRYGKVYLYRPVDNIPLANQAKVVRHILASQFGDKICMIEDIDTIPLQRAYFEDRISKRKPNHVLAIGAEVFDGTPHAGKFPMSNITAEGRVFKEFINPDSLKYDDLVRSWVDLSIMDHKEAINSLPSNFSDESLIRALLSKWDDSRVMHVARDVDIHNEWIDRSWWSVDEDKLERGVYIICNLLRPLDKYYKQVEPVIEYIFDNETDETSYEDTILL